MYDWKLSYEQKAELDTLDCGKRFIDFPWKASREQAVLTVALARGRGRHGALQASPG
jgi:hypothetical protein